LVFHWQLVLFLHYWNRKKTSAVPFSLFLEWVETDISARTQSVIHEHLEGTFFSSSLIRKTPSRWRRSIRIGKEQEEEVKSRTNTEEILDKERDLSSSCHESNVLFSPFMSSTFKTRAAVLELQFLRLLSSFLYIMFLSSSPQTAAPSCHVYVTTHVQTHQGKRDRRSSNLKKNQKWKACRTIADSPFESDGTCRFLSSSLGLHKEMQMRKAV
jgi:hypothetical protein